MYNFSDVYNILKFVADGLGEASIFLYYCESVDSVGRKHDIVIEKWQTK